MFERYTEKARRAIFFARYEASQFGSPFIETEHLLLGVLREENSTTRKILGGRLELEAIRKKIEGRTPVRERVSTSVDMPLSNDSKRVFAYAAEEAERLRHGDIGPEHLLLGLLREDDCWAARLLSEHGISLVPARELVSYRQAVHNAQAREGREIVEIHGEQFDRKLIEREAHALRKFVWIEREWAPRDVLVDAETQAVFLDLSLRDDPRFGLVPGGWTHDLCAICGWELNTDGGLDHLWGFTNGRDWVCVECYEKFLAPQRR